jgi:hypothetical protein
LAERDVHDRDGKRLVMGNDLPATIVAATAL